MPPRSRIRAYIGLGANLGDADASIADAIDALDGLPGVAVRDVSRLYATAPWGMTDQPEFRNAAVAIDVQGDPREPEEGALRLLGSLKALERRGGRRPRERWGPREIDLDLLVYGRHRVDVERSPAARSRDAAIDAGKAAKRLEVPHRDLGERLFVLAPLADLAPRLVPPGWHQTIGMRRRQVASAEPTGAVRVVGEWDASRRRWRAAR